MRILRELVTAFLLLLFLFPAPSIAEIKSIKIRSDNRHMILFEKFGFTHTGFTTVAVSNVSVTSKTESHQGFDPITGIRSTIKILSDSRHFDPSHQGFFLVSEESIIQVLHELQQNPDFCVLDSKYILLLFTFRDLSPPPHASFHHSPYSVTNPNEYSLFFANCQPESLVTMDVRIELFNNEGATKDYLSLGLRPLPSLYYICWFIYQCIFAIWIYLCFHKQRTVHQIHLLIGALLMTKALSLFCESEDKHYVKVIGSPSGWNIVSVYIFQFLNTVLSFTVIVLISAGWPYLKPFLLGKEKKVLMIVIPLQVLANVASIVIRETGPYYKHWVTWNQVFMLSNFICCCAAIFPVVWSMGLISRTDAKGERNLKAFRVFCVAVIGYLLFSTIGVFALKIVAAYKYQWVCSAAEEIARIVFYLVMLYLFRPVEDLVLDTGCEYVEAPEMVKG